MSWETPSLFSQAGQNHLLKIQQETGITWAPIPSSKEVRATCSLTSPIPQPPQGKGRRFPPRGNGGSTKAEPSYAMFPRVCKLTAEHTVPSDSVEFCHRHCLLTHSLSLTPLYPTNLNGRGGMGASSPPSLVKITVVKCEGKLIYRVGWTEAFSRQGPTLGNRLCNKKSNSNASTQAWRPGVLGTSGEGDLQND